MIIPTSVAVLSVICILKLHDNLFNCFFYIMGPNFASICFIFHSLLHTLSVYRSIYLYIYLSVWMSVYTTDCVLRYTWLNAAQANILMVLSDEQLLYWFLHKQHQYLFYEATNISLSVFKFLIYYWTRAFSISAILRTNFCAYHGNYSLYNMVNILCNKTF